MNRPFWSEDEDDYASKAVKMKLFQDELPDAPIPDTGIQDERDIPAYAAPDMISLPNEDDPEISPDRILKADPDPDLDEPEWGVQKDAPDFDERMVLRPWDETEEFKPYFQKPSSEEKS
jgi:hypothetical protein